MNKRAQSNSLVRTGRDSQGRTGRDSQGRTGRDSQGRTGRDSQGRTGRDSPRRTSRTFLRGLAVSALVVAMTSGAVAQEAATQPALPEAGSGAIADAPAAEPQVSETHVVSGGDTLWDLCTKYLNSPWYWPKIWSYNPQITNPHWIYPGNELRFYPSDENLPTAVGVSRDFGAPPTGEEFVVPGSLDVEDMVKSVSPVAVSRVPGDSVFSLYRGVVSAAQQDVAGQIVNSPEEGQMLSDFDRVYVKLRTAAKKGENYAVYRTVKRIEHPFSGDTYGYAIEIVGGLTIIDTSPQVATAEISNAFRPIERGQFVGPWPENIGRRIQPSANEADVKAYIIETLEPALSEVGEHHVVFIDKGRSDGVKLGNTFVVFGRGDRYTRDLSGLPNEELGRLLVIDVQDHAASAMVVRSIRELSVGDKAEMRKAI